MLYSPFLPPALAYSGVSPGAAVSSRLPIPNPAPQIGAQQISHPAVAYQPTMMGARTAQSQQGQGGLGGINPQQLMGLLGMLKGSPAAGGGMQYMGTLPGGTVNYGPGLLAAAAQGVDPELAMGGL